MPFLASGPGWSVEHVTLDGPLRPNKMAAQPGAPASHFVVRGARGFVLGTLSTLDGLAELAELVPLPGLTAALTEVTR